MIVELISLLPDVEEKFEEFTALAGERAQQEYELSAPEGRVDRMFTFSAAEENLSGILPGTAGESVLAHLLEQLIRSSERNADSSEKIAELLESDEKSRLFVYS